LLSHADVSPEPASIEATASHPGEDEMKLTARSLLTPGVLALAGLLGPSVGSSHAQTAYYVQPYAAYSPYYQGGSYYRYPAYARNYAVAPQRYYRPAPPNPGIGGNGYHYGYFPARRELPLYKPWLARD
jgi:hypothetical protein